MNKFYLPSTEPEQYSPEPIRVYAVILTTPSSKESKALHVKATWARRFNGYMFISSVVDETLPSIRKIIIL